MSIAEEKKSAAEEPKMVFLIGNYPPDIQRDLTNDFRDLNINPMHIKRFETEEAALAAGIEPKQVIGGNKDTWQKKWPNAEVLSQPDFAKKGRDSDAGKLHSF